MAAKATIQGSGLATFGATVETARATIATGFRYGLALLPLIPAVRVNLDTASQGSTWTIFAIGSVIAGAVFTELSLEGRGWLKTALFAALAAFFISLNVLNAIGNSASQSDVARDVASSQRSQKERMVARRSELSQSRKEQVAIAGNASPESIEAEIKEAKAANAAILRASQDCDTERLYSDRAKTFCASLAKLEAKKAAATERDKIDVQLAKLDTKLDTKGEAPPAAIESYVANMSRFLAMLGYTVDEQAKELLAASRDWLKGIGVELLAAFGPSALLSLLSSHLSHQPAPQQQPLPQATRKPEKAAKAIVAPMVAETPENASATVSVNVATSQDPQLSAFRDARLENIHGDDTRSTPVYEAWQQHCTVIGIEPGSQKAFCQRLQALGVGYTRLGNRPRYLNVRLKAAPVPLHPKTELRLAVVNS